MDRGAWGATVHGVERSRTQLSDLARTHPARHQGPCLTGCKSHTWQVVEPGFKPSTARCRALGSHPRPPHGPSWGWHVLTQTSAPL